MSMKSNAIEGFILLTVDSEEGFQKLQKMLPRILTGGVSFKRMDKNLVLLSLNDSLRDVAIFKASFPALLVDNDFLNKDLVLPSNNSLFYSFLNLVDEHTCMDLFKVAKKHAEVYDELYDLVGNFDKETLHTILVYIENNCSPLLSSYALFVHKNTVTYRVNNFVKKTGIHLDNFANQMFLYQLIASREDPELEMF